MLILFQNICDWLNTDEGEDLAELGFFLGLIAVVIAVAVAALGDNLLTYAGLVVKAVAAAWIGGSTG